MSAFYEKTEYKREEYILNKFANHVKSNYEEGRRGKVSKYYSAIIAVLQSSGYGKSRFMERFGSRTPTFYASLQDGSGYPEVSFFLKRLIEELNVIVDNGVLNSDGSIAPCYINNISTAVYVYLLRIFCLILSGMKVHKLYRYP